MKEKIVFSLLKKTYHHNKLLLSYDHIIRTDELGIEVLDEALDLLELSPENQDCNSPEFFDRDYLYARFYDLEDGTDEEIQAFMDYAKTEAARIKKVIEDDKEILEGGQDLGWPGR